MYFSVGDALWFIFLFLFLELKLFDHGWWKELHDRVISGGEVHLFELVKKLALHAKSDGTVNNYTSNLCRWVKYAKQKGFNIFPASVVDLALFMLYLSTTRAKISQD